MAETSSIEWTDATWNPVTGCSIVSPGCTNCYAMGLAGTRLKNHPSRAGLTREVNGHHVWTGEVRLNEQWLTQPLAWKTPRRVFVCAHGDLFHEDVPDEWIDRVFAVMATTSRHTYQVLTKRSKRMLQYLSSFREDGQGFLTRDGVDGYGAGVVCFNPKSWPLPNVWIGVSAERQQEADARIPDLLATPAAVRFVSAEPLLGPIDFNRIDVPGYGHLNALDDGYFTDKRPPRRRLDWIIVGGESGAGARPMHPDWARSIRDQCTAAGVPLFFKQWGTWKSIDQMKEPESEALYRSNRMARNGENQANLDDCYGRTCKVETATIRYDGKVFRDHSFGGFEVVDGHYGYLTFHVGKKSAGRLLDGREWSDMPDAPSTVAGAGGLPVVEPGLPARESPAPTQDGRRERRA